jgi:hypothetical protein
VVQPSDARDHSQQEEQGGCHQQARCTCGRGDVQLLIVMRHLLQVLAFYFESGAAAVAQGGMMNGEDVQLDEKTEAVRPVAAQPASPLISTAAVASATPTFLSSSSLLLLTESPQSSISVLQPPHAPKHSPLTMALPAPPTPPQVILTPPAISQSPAQIRTHDKEVQAYEEPHVTWSVADAEQDTAAAETSAGHDGEGWESGHGR